jgi:hypothetical protein
MALRAVAIVLLGRPAITIADRVVNTQISAYVVLVMSAARPSSSRVSVAVQAGLAPQRMDRHEPWLADYIVVYACMYTSILCLTC